MSLPKLESSRSVTSKVISNRVKARKSKSIEQYDCKLFFRLDGRCNPMVELSNSTGWDFDSTIKFNASTGEEHCEWFVCGAEVAFDIYKESWLHTYLSFFSRDQQVHCIITQMSGNLRYFTCHFTWTISKKTRFYHPIVAKERFKSSYANRLILDTWCK